MQRNTMNIKRFFLCLSLLVFVFINVHDVQGQKRMNRHIRAGNVAYKNNQYQLAIEKYKKGFSKIKGKNYELKGEISFRMGEMYRLNGGFRRAKNYYYRAIRYDYAVTNPDVYLYYAQALQMNEDYEKAIEAFEKYLEYKPENALALKGIASCKLADEWQKDPAPVTVENVKRINSSQNDFAPTYVDKYYSSIIFTSNRDEASGDELDLWTGKKFADIFYAKKDRQGKWQKPVLVDTKNNINTEENEGSAKISPSFENIYFTRCVKRKGNPAGCKIYKASRSGVNWGKAEEIKLSNDSATIYGHPTVNMDEDYMIMASPRNGGKGGKDLYYSEKVDGKWTKPINLSDVINTQGDEVFPFLLNDSVLYFSSNGHLGMGGLDIFRSEKKDGKWQKPENLRYPYNSVADDFGFIKREKREEGFFTSNRKGSRKDDIYYYLNPPVEFTLKGKVMDEETLQPVEKVEVQLINLSEKSQELALTDPEGFFSYSQSQLLPNKTYLIKIEKDNYFSVEDTIKTTGFVKSTEFDKKYNLNRIPDKAVVLPEILFDLGKWELKKQYQDSLQGLIQRLDANENIVIELAAHTDARSDDEYNDILSQKRAESVVKYLIDRGIDPDRLLAKGYGERAPRVLEKDMMKNDVKFPKNTVLTEAYIDSLDSKEKQELAHQLNRRIEFRVIRKDFIPKESVADIEESSAIALITNPNSNTVNYIPGKGTDILFPAIINGYTFNISYSQDYAELAISPQKAKELLDKGLITKRNFDEYALKFLKKGKIPNQTEITIDEIRIGAAVLKDVKASIFKYVKNGIQIGPEGLKAFGSYKIDEENFKIIFSK